MALGYLVIKKFRWPNNHVNLVQLTFDNTYAAGGYVLDPTSCGLPGETIECVVPLGAGEGAGASPVMVWDETNSKLKVVESATAGAFPTEIGAADANNVKGNILVIGKAPTG